MKYEYMTGMALALGLIGLILCCSGVQLREERCIMGRLWKDRCEEMSLASVFNLYAKMPKHVCIVATCTSQAFLNIFFMSNMYRLYHNSPSTLR
jgi:hypothetical protein